MVARLRDAIQRGTTAAKPAATAVDVGTLYFDTTLDELQRSDGTNWQSIEKANAASAFVGAKAYNDAVQSIPNNTDTALTLNSEEYDTDTIHDTATNTSRATVPTGKGGKWRIHYHTAASTASATGIRVAFLRKNGTTRIRGSNARVVGSTAVNVTLEGGADIDLLATDYVEVIVFQNSGGALDFGFSDASNASVVSTLEAQFLG